MSATPRIIDGDGHIMEDSAGITKFLPAPYNQRTNPRWFPPLDHFHSFIGETPPGSFRQVGVEGWMDFMEDVGLESAVLYTTQGLSYGKIFHTDWAIALCQAYNNWVHETYLTHSDRFNAVALIPLQEPSAAVDELHRCVEELGFIGAMLPSTGLAKPFGAKEYWPVWAAADKLGCALGIHGGAHSGMGFDQLNVYTPVGAMGHPFGLLIQFASVIFNGVLDNYPNARWGFMEGGVGWLHLALERFDRGHETHIQYNPRGELTPAPDVKVSDYIRKHIKEGRLFIGCEGDEEALPELTRMVGAEAFVFSSDFPHEVNNDICKHEIEELLEQETLSQSEKEAILAGNAERFYGVRKATDAARPAAGAAAG